MRGRRVLKEKKVGFGVKNKIILGNVRRKWAFGGEKRIFGVREGKKVGSGMF